METITIQKSVVIEKGCETKNLLIICLICGSIDENLGREDVSKRTEHLGQFTITEFLYFIVFKSEKIMQNLKVLL